MHEHALEPIAVIGMGCRMPGAPDIPAFWELLRSGTEAVIDVPPERWDRDQFYDPRPATPGKTVSRRGGFIEDIELFDPYFFGISPRHAVHTDPQHRLLLEAAWEALESAGLSLERIAGTKGGVYLGLCTDDYMTLERDSSDSSDVSAGMNSNRGGAAGRLSYFFDLRGPSLSLDTACSSSAAAIHLACNGIRAGDCDIAMAGGANLVLHPLTAVAFSQAGMLSADGRCKTFDATADGFVRSEGAGMVILKSLKRALADGDPIQAVILSSAMNNDGPDSPMMTPSKVGQEAVLRAAYDFAGISPAQVQYVEAHGTGTVVGDPIEMASVRAVLGEGRDPGHVCLVGSCKTNIGHLEAGAGVASLIKTVLCLQHRTIVPTLNCKTLNPAIPWDEIPFRLQQESCPWPDTQGEPARAGVNSFGITGTNVHIVVEEAPPAPRVEAPADAASEGSLTRAHLLALSAHTSDALKDMARVYRDWLSKLPGRGGSAAWEDICYSAGAHRTHHDHRLAVVADNPEAVIEHLGAFIDGETRDGVTSGQSGRHAPPVFVFSGVGTHWIGMGSRLREEEPVFRQALERCDGIFRPLLGHSIIEAIDAPEAMSRLEEVDVMQPAIFSMQVALAALWESWGVRPGAVVGHSLGEFAAAFVAGVLTLEEAALVVFHRSRLMKQAQGRGRMLAVELSMKEALAIIHGLEDRVSVAAWNGPSSSVLSGDPATLEQIEESLRGRSIFCRYVRAGVAFHSPQMDSFKQELHDSLESLRPRPATIPLYSTVTARREDGTTFDGAYCVRNMREPVHFAPVVRTLVDEGHDVFLEVSPHPVLLTPSRQCGGSAVIPLGSLRREQDGRSTLLGTLAALYCNGLPISWACLYPRGGTFIPPPPYPFQRERFWFTEPGESRSYFSGLRRGVGDCASDHPLFTAHWQPAHESGTHVWEASIDTVRFPYLADHSRRGRPLLPISAYVEMALAASIEAFGPGPRTLRRVQLNRPLFVSAESHRLQLVLTPDLPGTLTFRFFHLDGDAWEPLVQGEVVLREETVELPFPTDVPPGVLASRMPLQWDAEAFYASTPPGGMEYGPTFQGVEEVRRDGSDALVTLHCPGLVAGEAASYRFHPAFLDCVLHGYWALTLEGLPEGTLPVGIDALQFSRLPQPGERLWCRIHVDDLEDERVFSLALYDDRNEIIVRERGHHTRLMASDDAKEDPTDWLYEVAWEEKVSPAHPVEGPGHWLVISDPDGWCGRLFDRLAAQGQSCTVCPPARSRSEMVEVLRRFRGDEPWRGVLHLAALRAPGNDELDPAVLARAQDEVCGSLVYLLQALTDLGQSPPVWVVTRGAQAVRGESPQLAQAPLTGLARVAAAEHPALHVRRIDLDPREGSPQSLLDEIGAVDGEPEVALRGEQRLVARLVGYEKDGHAPTARVRLMEDENFRVESAGDGILDHLVLKATDRTPPAAGQVEIEVCAAGLNFLDVLNALNSLPGNGPGATCFGLECAGRIVSVGDGVTSLRPGDEVVAMEAGGQGTFRRYLTVPEGNVFKKPPGMAFEEAVTLPVAYQTAWYALHWLGRLRKGESVLIHCGAGGVGQAAVHIALLAGAEVYATAGTPEKRSFLKSIGVREVMSSRTLDFADEIMKYTDGRGVDVVLNSLAGEAIPRSLGVLATGGRFLEIGKRDIYSGSRLTLLPFQKNLMFFAIDMYRLSHERPDVVTAVTAELVDHICNGDFPPLPHQVFPISQVADAFRHMAQGRHTGKIVLRVDEPSLEVEKSIAPPVRADATYLVTGGMGALGLAFSRHLVSRGARYLALLGRRGVTANAQAAIDELRAAGATVATFAADVSNADDLARVLDDLERSMPPVRGVLHAAGSTRDGILQLLEWEQFEAVMAPKVQGTWNLHRALRQVPLDFLVLFSSAATTFGAAGQGNYAAANAFLDGLARCRQADGLPALSVSWGPWADIGMAHELGDRLAVSGVSKIPPAAGTALLDTLLAHHATHVTVAPVDWKAWKEVYPDLARVPLLARLVEAGDEAGGAGSGLPADPPSMEAYLKTVISRVLKVSPERLDASITLNRLGLDSLMAVELKNRIDMDLSVTVPVVKLLEGPSIGQMAAWLLSQVKAPGVPAAEPEEKTAAVSPNGKPAGEKPAVEPVGTPAAAEQPPLRPTREVGAPVSRDTAEPGDEYEMITTASCGQQRLWLLDQFSPGDPSYNISSAMHMRGPLDAARVAHVFTEIVRRHEALRTRFTAPSGELVARVAPPRPVEVAQASLEDVPAEVRDEELHRRIVEEARRPFDLAAPPLLRALLLRLSEHEHVLVTTVHHIAYDAWSGGVMANEFTEIYANRPLRDLPVQYGDYARWQQAHLGGEAVERGLAYWTKTLSGLPYLQLPTDHSRPPIASHKGAIVGDLLPAYTVDGLKQVCRQEDVTFFMLLLAAFQTLLARESGQTDIAIGCPIADRDSRDFTDLIGFFVNTLAIRGDLSGNPTFGELLGRTRKACLGAYAHKDVPFEKIVERLKVPRDASRNPVFQVAMALENVPFHASQPPGIQCTPILHHIGSAKFDLYLELLDIPQGLLVSIEYSTDLYEATRASRLLKSYLALLREVAEDPSAVRVSDSATSVA